jgi:hypothetical protein
MGTHVQSSISLALQAPQSSEDNATQLAFDTGKCTRKPVTKYHVEWFDTYRGSVWRAVQR